MKKFTGRVALWIGYAYILARNYEETKTFLPAFP